MKKNIYNSKGVTLIALIVTIIVLLILASVATYSGIEIINSSKLTTFTAEMKIMQTQVNSLYDQYKNEQIDKDTIGKSLTSSSEVQEQANFVLIEELGLANNISELTGFRFFDQETIQDLGIQGVKQEFFINIEKREVISYKGLKYEGDMYYTLNQLPQGLYNVDYDPSQSDVPTFDVNYEIIGENKYRVTISNIQYDGYIDKWYVQYQEEGADYWNTTEDLSFVVDTKGWYNIYIENGSVKSENQNVYIGNSAQINEEYWRKTTETDSEWYSYADTTNGNAQVVVNEPKLTGYMVPIKYVGEDKESQTGSKWANAITADGSMWVWIPRYAYKITSGYHTNSETGGTIEIVFIDTNNNFLNGESGTIVTDPEAVTYMDDGTGNQIQNEWLVHPAFTSSAENGGGFGELTGLWVGKFEATGSYDSDTETGTLSVKPATSSLREMTINQQYKLAKSSTFGEIATINSHMAKNSEWGAVAYLTQSKYGVNKQKVQNNDNEEYITGGSNEEETIYKINKLQSTTYNAYGVYDTNGGGWERIAGYVNYEDNSEYLKEFGGIEVGDIYGVDAIERETSTAYKTVYEANGVKQLDNYNLSEERKGDAIWETSNSYLDSAGSWFYTYADFPVYSYPFLARGEIRKSQQAGLFFFDNSNGIDINYCTFRPMLAF